jgi:hypothetical protein
MRKLLFALVIMSLSATWALAQSDNSDNKDKSATRTITGCLQKTGDPNEFRLIGNDGSNWEVRSDTVSLAEHAGQTVSATGVVSDETAHNLKEDTKNMAHDTGMKKNNAEHGHLRITDLQTVSHSCSQ